MIILETIWETLLILSCFSRLPTFCPFCTWAGEIKTRHNSGGSLCKETPLSDKATIFAKRKRFHTKLLKWTSSISTGPFNWRLKSFSLFFFFFKGEECGEVNFYNRILDFSVYLLLMFKYVRICTYVYTPTLHTHTCAYIVIPYWFLLLYFIGGVQVGG